MKYLFFFVIILLSFHHTKAQQFADVLLALNKDSIPEVGYAVVSSDSILDIYISGVKKAGTSLKADINDRFRIGSNTKAITGFIAALLVKEKKISWSTKFFDLYPELKKKSKKAYHKLSLLDLLSFRTRLYPYTYTYPVPVQGQFTGNEAEQRYQFTQWFFKQKPVTNDDTIHFSNLGYIAAGLMLEKASGISYKELVTDLGKQLDIDFGFGQPNQNDTLQTWGHNRTITPEPPGDNYKLDWLLSAGNINASLPHYSKFIQLQLLGLSGKSSMLSRKDFYFLHYGLPKFAVGWFNGKDEYGNLYSYNTGNPGTYLTKVNVYSEKDIAIIIFCNAQSSYADKQTDYLLQCIKAKYGLTNSIK